MQVNVDSAYLRSQQRIYNHHERTSGTQSKPEAGLRPSRISMKGNEKQNSKARDTHFPPVSIAGPAEPSNPDPRRNEGTSPAGAPFRNGRSMDHAAARPPLVCRPLLNHSDFNRTSGSINRQSPGSSFCAPCGLQAEVQPLSCPSCYPSESGRRPSWSHLRSSP